MTSENGPVLTAREVEKTFSTPDKLLPVLKGIDLELAQGEVVAVTGASGVGKSTLLHILGGLDRPTRGEITILGTAINRQSEKALARFRNHRIGFVFQFHYLLDDFSALENVMIPMILADTPRAEARQRGELLLEQVGLQDRTSHRPRQLSGGEQQRVAVARALANAPEIVLADEPTGNLDTTTGRALHDLLLRLNSRNKITFLIATHNEELANGCNRRLTMVDGRVFE
ncbi:ATP-binding cassette domain-containing protein [candidate division GN15 bacterium]|nr:ATP-binding cassette domain-containing protein [candidate division GN15 bacterium]